MLQYNKCREFLYEIGAKNGEIGNNKWNYLVAEMKQFYI
jgi:hypothetical protein